MPIFEYQATDKSGNKVRGTVVSQDLGKAQESLVKRGLVLDQVWTANTGFEDTVPPSQGPRPFQGAQNDPTTSTGFTHNPSFVDTFRNRVTTDQLYFLFRQLAVLNNAGISMREAMHSIQRQSTSAPLREFATRAVVVIDAGGSVSDAMREYPHIFQPIQLAIVTAGERSGNLSDSFNQLAEDLDFEMQLTRDLKWATFMPKIAFFGMFVIVLGTNAILQRISGSGMFNLWSPLVDWKTWLWLAPIFIIYFLITRFGIKYSQFRAYWDRFICYVPYIGLTVRQFAMARFGNAFGAMYKAGVPMSECAEVAANSCGNVYIRDSMLPAIKSIQEGRGVSEALMATGMLDPTVVDMLSTGERTGNVDFMLIKMAEYYRESARLRARKSNQVYGVAILVIVAIFVAITVGNFYVNYFGSLFRSVDG